MTEAKRDTLTVPMRDADGHIHQIDFDQMCNDYGVSRRALYRALTSGVRPLELTTFHAVEHIFAAQDPSVFNWRGAAKAVALRKYVTEATQELL